MYNSIVDTRGEGRWVEDDESKGKQIYGDGRRLNLGGEYTMQ